MTYRTLGYEGTEIALSYQVADVRKRAESDIVKRKTHIDIGLERDEVVVEEGKDARDRKKARVLRRELTKYTEDDGLKVRLDGVPNIGAVSNSEASGNELLAS